MALFTGSTQLKYWTFEPGKIENRKGKGCTTVSKIIRENETELTHVEKLAVINDCVRSLVSVCKKEEYYERTIWTAVVLYRRYFVVRDVAGKCHPKIMILAAISVAAKVEEEPLSLQKRGINLDRLCRVYNVSPAIVAQYEINLIRGLEGQLVVFNPLDVFESYCKALQDCIKRHEIADAAEMRSNGRSAILEALYSHLCLCGTPHEIAVAGKRLYDVDVLESFNIRL